MNKHPAAHDPMLQDKIDKICQSPEEWSLMLELERSRDHLEHNKRMVRALDREIERTEKTIGAMELALINILEMKKEVVDR